MSSEIVVIGGGVAGLTAAREILKLGGNVTLLEATGQLGGLGTFFRSENHWVDRFYHCMMPTDSALLRLIDELGLGQQVYWKPTRMGFIVNGKRFSFNTPFDLLRFSPIPFIQRLRFGFVSLVLRQLGKGKDLDNLSTRAFLKPLYGDVVWKTFWKPLFRMKFGPHAADLPALYLWRRLGRESNVAKRGYLNCGFKGLIDALQEDIEARGGSIRLRSPVKAIRDSSGKMKVELTEGEALSSDWVISTAPLPLLKNMIQGSSLENQFTIPDLPAQGVVNALFFLSRRLDGHYWTPVVNSGTGFDGVVEMSTLVEPAQYGGRQLVYVMKYCDRNSVLFQRSDDEILDEWTNQFLKLFEDLPLTRSEVTEKRLFKAPFVEPAYPLGYLAQKPPLRAGSSNLVLATTAQVYPSITSFNSSARLALQAVAEVMKNN
jgi:protoporphyrinogen oxidase